MCEDFAWVCDIGCGPLQSLRHFLPAKVIYLPADLRMWEPRVLACDLNARWLPEPWLRLCDVVCMLGVIEYVNDLESLFSALVERVEALVISYNCADFAVVDRSGFGWVNALTSGTLHDLLEQAGFQVIASRRVGDMELLVKARNSRYGAWRKVRRRAARFLHAGSWYSGAGTPGGKVTGV